MAEGLLLNRSRQVPAEETPAFGGIAERFRRAGDLERAIALCREGLQRFPNQLSARVTLGWSLLDKGQYEEARAELEYVLRRAPDNFAAIRGLAQLHDRAESSMPSMEGHAAWHSSHEEATHAAPQPSLAIPATTDDAPLVLESPAQALLAAAGASVPTEETGVSLVPIREDIAEEWLQHEAAAAVEPAPASIEVQAPTDFESPLDIKLDIGIHQEAFEAPEVPVATLSIETSGPPQERRGHVVSPVPLDLDLGDAMLDPVAFAAADPVESVAPALVVDAEPHPTPVNTPAAEADSLRHALLTSVVALPLAAIDDEDWPSELDPDLPPATAQLEPVARVALSETDPLEALGISLPLEIAGVPAMPDAFAAPAVAGIAEEPFAVGVDTAATDATDSFMLTAPHEVDPEEDALLSASLGMSADSIAALVPAAIELPLLDRIEDQIEDHIEAEVVEPEFFTVTESNETVTLPEISRQVAEVKIPESAVVEAEPAGAEPEVADEVEIHAPAAAMAVQRPGRAGVLVMAPRGSETRSPVAALERFLRKVRTRRLQLTTGSVA